MAIVQSPKECLVCLNSNETIFVSIEESQKIFNVCCSYVKDAINIEFLINNINGNNNQLSFCKNCFHSSINISQLVEQLTKLKKEIGDLASCFSKSIEKRRFQAKAYAQIIELNHGNTKSQVTNNLDSSRRLVLNEVSIDSEDNSFIHSEVSNKLIVAEEVDDIDEVRSETVKTENHGIFLDYVEGVSVYPEEEFDTNSFVAENEHEIDPFGEIETEPTIENDNDGIPVNESKPQIGTCKSACELVSSATMQSIKLKRIPNDVTTKRDTTFDSTKISHHEDHGANFSNNLPGDSGPICNSASITTNEQRHRTYKLGKKPFSCFICEKRFSASSDLKRHHLTHTREKPYKCAFCEKAYRQSTHLKIHERTHTGEKPYKCSKCKRSFHECGALKYHETTHIKVKPYKCSYCHVEFKLPLSLKEHQSKHTGETPFDCRFCELKFKTTRARLSHQKKVHSYRN